MNQFNNDPSNCTILLLDDPLKNNVLQFIKKQCQVHVQLFKQKFTRQQQVKKLWLENREREYDYIPIEFSKDSYFMCKYLTSYSKLTIQEREKRARQPIILPDHLKSNMELVLKSFFCCDTASGDYKDLMGRVYCYCNENERNVIEFLKERKRLKSTRTNAVYYGKLLNCGNEELILEGIGIDCDIFNSLESQYRNDKMFILKAIHRNCQVLNHVSYFYSDREFILECINNIDQNRETRSIFDQFITHFSKDRQVILEIAKKGMLFSFTCLSKESRNDREIAMHSVQKNANTLSSVSSDELKNDREFVLNALKINIQSLKFASEELKKDRDFMLKAIQVNGQALEYAPSELRNDRELALQSVKNYGRSLQFLPSHFKNDKEIVMEAVKQDGYAFLYSSNQLQQDREIELITLSNDGLLLQYFPYQSRLEYEMISRAIEKNPLNVAYSSLDPHKEQNRLLILKAMKSLNSTYSTQLFNFKYFNNIKDEEIAFELVKTNPRAIHVLSQVFKENYRTAYEATLLLNGYWISFSENDFQERINQVYGEIKIDSHSECHYYRNTDSVRSLWSPTQYKW